MAQITNLDHLIVAKCIFVHNLRMETLNLFNELQNLTVRTFSFLITKTKLLLLLENHWVLLGRDHMYLLFQLFSVDQKFFNLMWFIQTTCFRGDWLANQLKRTITIHHRAQLTLEPKDQFLLSFLNRLIKSQNQ